MVMPTVRGRVFEASIELVASSSDFARNSNHFWRRQTVDGKDAISDM